jgi:hypothetical protein
MYTTMPRPYYFSLRILGWRCNSNGRALLAQDPEFNPKYQKKKKGWWSG